MMNWLKKLLDDFSVPGEKTRLFPVLALAVGVSVLYFALPLGLTLLCEHNGYAEETDASYATSDYSAFTPDLYISGEITTSKSTTVLQDSQDANVVLTNCCSIAIGPVTIDAKTGNVTIEEGVEMNKASRAFWREVEKQFPEIFKQKGGAG